ncbi:hypothetical protein AB0G87_00235 [Streptomyces asoensis]|uniref:hypothetical protein n=1 Tax=Streptomyces asoensis TaxID=249586 RepID=UPI0033E90777
MSDQHAATALTAAAVIAAILIARATVLRQSSPRPTARTAQSRRHRDKPRTPTQLPVAGSPDVARIVREAERHVHRCWQQLGTRAEPPD